MDLVKVKDKFKALNDLHKSINEDTANANALMQWIIDSGTKCIGAKPIAEYAELGFEEEFSQEAYLYCTEVLKRIDKYIKFHTAYMALETLADLDIDGKAACEQIEVLSKMVDDDFMTISDFNSCSLQQYKAAYIATLFSRYPYDYIMS